MVTANPDSYFHSWSPDGKTLAFTGERLDEAKLGTLGTVVIAPAIAWVMTRIIRRLPSSLRARQIGRTSDDILDLVEDVDPDRDHIRGPDDALVTLLEYGDFECHYCGQAESVIRELLTSHGDVRYVWRHLPLNDVHPMAQLAAEASEAAAAQGKFWEMYDTLLSHQNMLTMRDLVGYAHTACLVLTAALTGMRESELMELRNGCRSGDRAGCAGRVPARRVVRGYVEGLPD